MKKLVLFVCAAFVAGALLAQVTPVLAAARTHEMKATVVSVNLEEKMITIKDEAGEEKTAPVIGKAVGKLKTVHAGDKVTLTCQDKENGEHEGVSAIKVEKA